jgi:RsiW-degrading membrane proteinase PrsW (M82 family)
MVSIVLVLSMQLFASVFQLDQLHNLRRIIFYALVIMAFFSELGKFFILKIFIYPRKEFNTPVDGIIYGVIISLGFATMNNIIYLFNIPDLTVNLANAYSAGPAAVVFGVMMGFFVGLGKLRRMRFIDSMTGLAAAIFFHGLYDFCLLTEDYRMLWAFFAGSLIIVVSLCFAAIRIHQEAKIEEKK